MTDQTARTETPAEKVMRNIARRAGTEIPSTADQPGLPTSGSTELIELTLDELHDLIVGIVREASLTVTITDPNSRRLADRAAMLGRMKAQAHDGYRRGADPRA